LDFVTASVNIWAVPHKIVSIVVKVAGLGYRDLHIFNLAMLARQGWRILQNPDSLCAQILCAEYGVNGSLMEAKEKAGISYSWRSIVRGIKALNKGLIWRIGDGTQVRKWADAWIAAGITRRPITPRGEGTSSADPGVGVD
jgi:hypothetical protein